MSDHKDLYAALAGHRFYRYRGCAPAPDPDFPGQSLGNPALHIDAWLPVSDPGGEPQPVHRAREAAAVAVCQGCPVRSACAAYALSETADGHLAEPHGVWGGLRSLQRHAQVVKRRHAALDNPGAPAVLPPVELLGDLTEARTPQKRALLVALAAETDEELVAYRAGMDLRLANFHRSHLTRMLGLDRRTATREQLLARAQAAGLLAPSTRIRADGRWPVAAAPNGDGSRQRRIGPGRPVQLVLIPVDCLPRIARRGVRRRAAALAATRARSVRPAGPGGPGGSPSGGRRVVRTRLRLVAPVPEQPALPSDEPTVLEPAA